MAVTLPTMIRGRTAVLLLAPGTDAAETPCLGLLEGDGSRHQRLVAVTVDGTGEAFVDAWVDRADTDRMSLRVVDVTTGTRSVATGRPDPSAERNVIQSVQNVQDVDSIRACVESIVGEPAPGGTWTIYLDSLDALIEETSSRAAFDLVDDLTALARLADGVAFVRVDPDETTRYTLETLASLFDVTLCLEPNGRDAAWVVQSARSVIDGDQPDATVPGVDELFRLLSVRDRRLVLHHLLETGRPMTTTDLAARIADVDQSDLAVQRVVTGLVHTHLPMLQEHDVISMDEGGDTVRLRPTSDRLGHLLAMTAKGDLLG